MARVTVAPESFSLVAFEAAEIADIVTRLLDEVGLPPDTSVRVEVDETTPLGRAWIQSLDPLVIAVESGALEDPKEPRHLSAAGAADVLGRLLFRVRDRRDAAFGDPPPDRELTLAQSVAWDTYAVGRLVRLGYRAQRQRRLYHFRTRHGFSDAADEAFERLWAGAGLTWQEIDALSAGARAAVASPDPARG